MGTLTKSSTCTSKRKLQRRGTFPSWAVSLTSAFGAGTYSTYHVLNVFHEAFEVSRQYATGSTTDPARFTPKRSSYAASKLQAAPDLGACFCDKTGDEERPRRS